MKWWALSLIWTCTQSSRLMHCNTVAKSIEICWIGVCCIRICVGVTLLASRIRWSCGAQVHVWMQEETYEGCSAPLCIVCMQRECINNTSAGMQLPSKTGAWSFFVVFNKLISIYFATYMFKHISTVSSATIRNMHESNRVYARITASCKENSFYRYFVHFHERVSILAKGHNYNGPNGLWSSRTKDNPPFEVNRFRTAKRMGENVFDP